MAKNYVYQAAGFYLLSQLESSGLRWYPVTAATKIEKGLAVFDDTNGYAYDTGTELTAVTFLGIAAAEADNSSGAAGAIDVAVIPLLPQYQFIVPVDGNAVITQTIVGTAIDIGATNGYVAVNESVTEGMAFIVDDIDASAAAVAINTYGYAIGHFVQIGTQA